MSQQKVTVSVQTRRPLLDQIKLRFKRVRFDKPFLKLWVYRMWMHSMFVIQGLAAILTLSFCNPNLTARPSRFVATAKHDVDDILKEESEVTAAKAEAEEKGEAYVAPVKDETVDPMDEWLTKFSKPKKYDAKGKLIKE
jgi:hypothetical protein